MERANANVALARDLHAADRPRESLAPLNTAIDLAEGAGLERVYASALLERGHAFLELGELEAAVRDLDQALALYRRLELADGQASALHLLARIAAYVLCNSLCRARSRLTAQGCGVCELFPLRHDP